MNTELFKKGLSSVLKITKEAPVLLETKNNRLIIASHNSFHSVIFEMETDLDDFKVVIPEKIARQIPSQVSKDFHLWIDENNEKAVINSENSEMEISILSPEALSLNRLAKNFEKEPVWKINGLNFKNAFNRVSHSANDKTIGDIVLRGYHMNIKHKNIEFMASNGAAMSVTNLVMDSDVSEERMFLLNQDFSNLIQLLHDEDFFLSYNENSVSLQFKTDEYTLRMISSLTSGNPFNYHSVVDKVLTPKNEGESKFVQLNVKEFKESLKKMNFFFDDSAKYRIKLDISNDELKLFSSNIYGSTENKVNVVSSDVNTEETIYLSGTNLFSYLNSVKSEDTVMYFTDALSPVLFLDNQGMEILTVFNV